MRPTRFISMFPAAAFAGLILFSSDDAALGGAAEARIEPVAVPRLPEVRPPTQIFRDLLAMNPSERETALSQRNPEARRVLTAKLEEYERMPAGEREIRLKVTELRWHLMPLLRIAPHNRSARLQMLPAEDRELITQRLEQWDRLPLAAQRQFLDHENTLLYFLRLEGGNLPQRNDIPPERRQQIESELAQWKSLPPDQRTRIIEQFNGFFELTERERERTLNTLSESERRQMEQTLATFEKLPPGQRRHCLESFRRFASMSPEERDQFLQSAQRWEAMSPDDRQTWRDLVNRLPQVPPMPPLPPGRGAAPRPPIPPNNF